MSDIEVYTEELRAAGHATREAAESVAGIELGAALTGVKSGLPGSRAASESSALAEHWDGISARCAERLAERAEKLADAADDYDSRERSAAEDFEGLLPRGPEGPI
ncbi:hypothetical protein H0B56_00800 [Haloechinothrix sp. YIM 98757]|uniref:Excreted virulence factor EspC, type VII ESX diderm n=1 Tax=Haloechinothrix aidingensis TaxID=2752311 RepID=A0A838A6Q0_9PSEU|nr:hypothetical protein [Haloechinothrix aidingensis]MBA0124077.1 hypothetical protein [Haloechinothrix aidingensis]